MNEKQKYDELIESIAYQVHKSWMEERIKNGWSYGPERNDSLKQTPCLVPYEKLSEEEKDVDRSTTKCVIQALMAAGYSINRN